MTEIDFDQAWTLLDIARLAEMAVEQERMASCDAEIVEGAAPDWYLIQTFPGQDTKALRALARRRFGVFQPMQQRVDRKSGRALQGYEPVFPGWLFVFCWDIDRMYRRILDCRGVMGILCYTVSGRPVLVNQPEMSRDGKSCRWPRIDFVDKLRALSWVYDERAPHARSQASVSGARHVKRANARLTIEQRRELQRLRRRAEECEIWDKADWAHANKLAPGERIRLLKRALS